MANHFTAEFDGHPPVRRTSVEHHFTHAWLVVAETAGEQVRRHGFTISRIQAERRIDEHRKLSSRPFSRVRVLRAQISEAVCDTSSHAVPGRGSMARTRAAV